jgi:putative Mg2+ transporter-C (MgtC) family protein
MDISLPDLALRIVVAAALGGVIGIERQIKGKVAGMRTAMLICTGASLFMVVSHLAADRTGDVGRIAAQVVSGIGFLGAGAILHSKAGVTGLTTAATIFVIAAIGLACGGGYWLPATITTGVVIFTLFLLGEIERVLDTRRQTFRYSFVTTDVATLMNQITNIVTDYKLVMNDVELNRKEDGFKVSFTITTTQLISQDVLSKLLATGSVARVVTHSNDTSGIDATALNGHTESTESSKLSS